MGKCGPYKNSLVYIPKDFTFEDQRSTNEVHQIAIWIPCHCQGLLGFCISCSSQFLWLNACIHTMTTQWMVTDMSKTHRAICCKGKLHPNSLGIASLPDLLIDYIWSLKYPRSSTGGMVREEIRPWIGEDKHRNPWRCNNVFPLHNLFSVTKLLIFNCPSTSLEKIPTWAGMSCYPPCRTCAYKDMWEAD